MEMDFSDKFMNTGLLKQLLSRLFTLFVMFSNGDVATNSSDFRTKLMCFTNYKI